MQACVDRTGMVQAIPGMALLLRLRGESELLLRGAPVGRGAAESGEVDASKQMES